MLQGNNFKKKKMGENKKAYLSALLGMKIILLYSRCSSGYQALYYTVLFSGDSWCFKGL